MAKKQVDKPYKIKTPIAEAEVLLSLKESNAWAVVKKAADRHKDKAMKVAFNVPENDPTKFALEHARFKGQVEGIKALIKYVDNIGKEVEKRSK